MKGRWWHDIPGGRIQCDLCPRDCTLSPGQRGFCFVRENQGGEMVLTSYGRASGFCLDPVEKKPLNHFYPGTSILSFGTAGCNLGCRFCQNWDISKAREQDRLTDWAGPEEIAAAAVESGARSIAFTYNDPVIFAEYAIDTARACRERGIATVAVTAGYIHDAARREFYAAMDAANVDLKGFTEDFYRKICFAHLEPVKETLVYLAKETDVWLEVTTLLIPDANDGDDEIARLCDWFLAAVGDEVPLHFTAFHPDFKMTDKPRTPPETLARAPSGAVRGLEARLHRERLRPRRAVDALRRLRRRRHRPRRLPHPRLRARRRRTLPRLRPRPARPLRRRGGPLGLAAPPGRRQLSGTTSLKKV